jgi:hypothetical protein
MQALNTGGRAATAQQKRRLEVLLAVVDTNGDDVLSREEIKNGLQLVEVVLDSNLLTTSPLWCIPLSDGPYYTRTGPRIIHRAGTSTSTQDYYKQCTRLQMK